MLQSGMRLAQVQRVLGHKDVTVTANTYGHINPAELRDEMGRVPRPAVGRLKVIGEE